MTDLYAPAQPSGPGMFPPPGFPPAGFPPAGGPPARQRQPWTRSRIAATGTAVFVAGGALIGLLASNTDIPTPRGAVEAFISAAQDGDYEAAYALLCNDYRDEYGSVREYAADAADDNPLTGGVSAEVTDVSYEGGGDYSVTTRLSRFGEHYTLDISVVQEHQAYLVCGVSSSDD